MKKILFVLFSLCLVLTTSCGNDEPSYDLTLDQNELAQTTWKANQIKYDQNNNVTFSENSILEFIDEAQGNFNQWGPDATHRHFNYIINKRLFNILCIYGSWTLIEKKKNRLVFQAYLPEKSILTLERDL